MSDKMQAGVKAGSTSVSVPVILRKTADNTEMTGIAAAGVSAAYYWRQGGTPTAITALSDLAAITSAFAAGGWKEADSTHQPGAYRLDVDDAAFATGADWVVIGVKVASAYAFYEKYVLTTNVVQSGDSFAVVKSGGTGDTAAIKAKTDFLPSATAGAAGGVFIAGSNAATTIAGLTTGALACSTITASGAVAFQSTFAVTTSTSLAALSCTTLTASGAVALQSSLAVTGNLSVAGGITVTQSTLNGNGVSITGNGTGHGISVLSGNGATGDGVHIVCQATAGNGIYSEGHGGGDGAEFTAAASINSSGCGLHLNGSTSGGGSGVGLFVQGSGTGGDAILAQAGTSGVGFNILGGSSGGGAAIRAHAQSGNSNGIDILGFGSGDGISADAGATGRGIHSIGGNVSGAGFRSEGSAGNANGFEAVANGTGKDLFLNTAGNNTPIAIQTNEIPLKKNTALNAYEFLMVLASDHVTPAIGLTVTGQVSINGAAFTSLTNAVSEVGNGVYKVNLAAADTNGDTITFKFTAATADQTTISHLTQ